MAIDTTPMTNQEMADYLDDFIYRIEHDELPLPIDEFELAATEAARSPDPQVWNDFYTLSGSQTFALLEALYYVKAYQALLRGQASAPRLSANYPKPYKGENR